MSILKQKAVAFLKSEKGLTTVEYAVAGGVIAGAVLLAFTGLGDAVASKLGQITTVLTS